MIYYYINSEDQRSIVMDVFWSWSGPATMIERPMKTPCVLASIDVSPYVT